MSAGKRLKVIVSEARRRFGRGGEEELRRLLREAPYWAGGHLALAELSLHTLEHAVQKPSPRTSATLRVSAEAALRLLEGSAANTWKAHYLLGAANFFDKDYAGAVNEFRHVLAPEAAGRVPVEKGLKALEYAGSSAMAMSDFDQALKFFTAIPAEARSGEVRTAIPYLEAIGRGEFQ